MIPMYNLSVGQLGLIIGVLVIYFNVPMWIVGIIIGLFLILFIEPMRIGVFLLGVQIVYLMLPMWMAGIIISVPVIHVLVPCFRIIKLALIMYRNLLMWIVGTVISTVVIYLTVPLWIVGTVIGVLVIYFTVPMWVFRIVIGVLASYLMLPMWIVGIIMGIVGIYLIKLLITEFLTYYGLAVSINNIIQEIQCLRHLPHKEFDTLNLHIVSKYPLFNKELFWDVCMVDLNISEFVDTMTLNLVFIVECTEQFESPLTSSETILSRGRIVTYTMKQMLYHMYYSSPEYTEPDAVLVYKPSEMLGNEDDAIHSEISFRNMTAKDSTVVALLDTTKERLKQGVKAVRSARPGLLVGNYKITQWNVFHFTLIQKVESNYPDCWINTCILDRYHEEID